MAQLHCSPSSLLPCLPERRWPLLMFASVFATAVLLSFFFFHARATLLPFAPG